MGDSEKKEPEWETEEAFLLDMEGSFNMFSGSVKEVLESCTHTWRKMADYYEREGDEEKDLYYEALMDAAVHLEGLVNDSVLEAGLNPDQISYIRRAIEKQGTFLKPHEEGREKYQINYGLIFSIATYLNSVEKVNSQS